MPRARGKGTGVCSPSVHLSVSPCVLLSNTSINLSIHPSLVHICFSIQPSVHPPELSICPSLPPPRGAACPRGFASGRSQTPGTVLPPSPGTPRDGVPDTQRGASHAGTPAPLPQPPCAQCCSGAKTPRPSRSTVPAGIIPATHALGEEDTLLKHCTALFPGARVDIPCPKPLPSTDASLRPWCHGEGQREKPA